MAATLADGIFNCIFLNEIDRIPIQISLKYVPRSSIDNKPALFHVMAWRRTGNKPLHGPMMTQFFEAWCCQVISHYMSQRWPRSMSSYVVTRPQWVNSFRHIYALVNFQSLVQVMACGLCQTGHFQTNGINWSLMDLNWWNLCQNTLVFIYENAIENVCNGRPFCSGLNMLTDLPLDKMAAILADNNYKCIFLNENDRIPIRISLKSVLRFHVFQHCFP